jgi:DNA-binding LacI/PurR family transcriptional regulator
MAESKSSALAEALLESFRSGALKPGAKAPSDNELSALYKVSRTTVRDAVARLVSSGHLERRRGSGTYVREPFASPSSGPQLCLLLFEMPSPELARHPFAEELLLGVHGRLAALGGSVRVEWIPSERQFIAKLEREGAPSWLKGGAICAGGSASRRLAELFAKLGIRLAAVGRPADGALIPYVDSDSFAGAYLGVELLAKAGRRKIVAIDRAKPALPSFFQRQEGVAKAFAAFKLEDVPERHVDIGSDSEEQGRSVAKRLLASGLPFDGLLVYGGVAFRGLMDELAKAGLRAPRDFSCVYCMGYRKLFENLDFVPSALMQPLREMGAAAASLLLDREARPEARVMLPFVLKGSTL